MSTDPLCVSLEVDCPVDHAFATWTSRFGDWWPAGHTASGLADTRVTLEPRPGGRIFETTPDGSETDWGEITEWDPPRRLCYLWHIRRDRADATDVSLTFVPIGENRTRLDIVHTGWDRLGADGATWRDANQSGWRGLLPHFGDACIRPAPG